jgi:endonuclease/exonuclease/phosphatase (EEP) superfamily protein YafD
MRWLLPGIVLMSVGFGTLLTTVVDAWLRGQSYLWWLLLMLLLMLGIVAFAITLTTRIR